MFLENGVTGVFVIAAAISLFIALIYRIFMDQEKLRKAKEKMEELQEKSKKAKKEGKQEEASEHMQEMMKHSSTQMKMQLKPMAITFIVIIPLFWFVFPGLYPKAAVNFNQTNTLEYKGIQQKVSLVSEDPLKVSINGEGYEKGEYIDLDGYRFQMENYNQDKDTLKLKRIAVMLPFTLPFFGNSFGWLGWYILIAIGLGQVFRKLLGAMP